MEFSVKGTGIKAQLLFWPHNIFLTFWQNNSKAENTKTFGRETSPIKDTSLLFFEVILIFGFTLCFWLFSWVERDAKIVKLKLKENSAQNECLVETAVPCCGVLVFNDKAGVDVAIKLLSRGQQLYGEVARHLRPTRHMS